MENMSCKHPKWEMNKTILNIVSEPLDMAKISNKVLVSLGK